MHAGRERALLQVAVAVGCLVPITAGIIGVWLGPKMVMGPESLVLPDLDSHFRYLSGLLLGIGACFAFCIQKSSGDRICSRFWERSYSSEVWRAFSPSLIRAFPVHRTCSALSWSSP